MLNPWPSKLPAPNLYPRPPLKSGSFQKFSSSIIDWDII